MVYMPPKSLMAFPVPLVSTEGCPGPHFLTTGGQEQNQNKEIKLSLGTVCMDWLGLL